MTKVKICGLTNYEDAKAAVDLGADALGFNFFSGSPRYITPEAAHEIVSRLPADCWFVGVFVNCPREDVTVIARLVGLDTLQFHGDEDAGYCQNWMSLRVIKALRVGGDSPPPDPAVYLEHCEHLLIDRYSPEQFGGTGEEVEDSVLDNLKQAHILEKAFLAGGIVPENVRAKIRRYKPFGIDVASGVESSPGKKSREKMKQLIERVK